MADDPVRCLLFVALTCLGACGSGAGTESQLVVLDTDPVDGGRVFLNQPVRFTFSNEIDLQSVSFSSIAFAAMDAAGNPLSESVTGEFHFARDGEGRELHRTIEFVPRTPTNDTFDNGG